MGIMRIVLIVLGIVCLLSATLVLTLIRFSSDLSREWETEDSEPEVANCPHCGGVSEYRTFTNYDGYVSYEASAVVCTQCGAQTKEEITSGYYGLSVEPAIIIQKWNRRCGR